MAAKTAPASQTETRPRLIEGRYMKCPRCEKKMDILAFQRMEDGDPKYAHETTPVYKCPRIRGGCGFFFALSDHAVVQNLNPDGVPEGITYE